MGVETDSVIGAELAKKRQELPSPLSDLQDVPQGVVLDQRIGQASPECLEDRGALIKLLMKASAAAKLGIKRLIENEPASLAEVERDIASWKGDGMVPAGRQPSAVRRHACKFVE
jgi:hypothetical protein